MTSIEWSEFNPSDMRCDRQGVSKTVAMQECEPSLYGQKPLDEVTDDYESDEELLEPGSELRNAVIDKLPDFVRKLTSEYEEELEDVSATCNTVSFT